MTELRNGILVYLSENSKFPDVDRLGEDFKTETSLGSPLLANLLGDPDKEIDNPRQPIFLWPRKAENKASRGVWGDQTGKFQLLDIWGNPFQIMMDGDRDGMIQVPNRSGIGTEEIANPVGVWSYGPNGVPGKGRGSRNDDYYSW